MAAAALLTASSTADPEKLRARSISRPTAGFRKEGERSGLRSKARIPGDSASGGESLIANSVAGTGCLFYKELREELWKVGVLTIFCWADMESAGFWLKQDGPKTTYRRFLGSTEPKSLKGLDHLRPGILQQQKLFLQLPQPFHRLQYLSLQQAQLLLQG